MHEPTGAATVYIGVDDTDNTESRGTGFLARSLALRLAREGLGSARSVTRHQLLVDDRIPYTSHNSAACIVLTPAGGIDTIARSCAVFLEATAAPGSDAGLCVAEEDRLTSTAVAFGERAKREVVMLGEAHRLAGMLGVHLTGHTGEKTGVIGALAAAGLCRGGNDGRFLELSGLRKLSGVVTVDALRAAGIRRFSCVGGSPPSEPSQEVDVGDWCRPILLNHEPTLLVTESRYDDGTVRWRIAERDHIKQF